MIVEENTSSTLDPITLSVFVSRLAAIANEMTIALENAAFTPILSLCRDYSCCVYDVEQRQIATADPLPIHTNSMGLVLAAISETFADDINEGDVIVCNDPYRGNTHIGDLVTACPVFIDQHLTFWTVARGHQLDHGAPIPISGYAGARNVWQEGIMIPPVKFVAQGEVRRDVVDMYLNNVRWRDLLEGDLMAQFGSIWTGQRRLKELCEEYGRPMVLRYVDHAIEYAARRTASELADMTRGIAHGEGYLDTDGATEINIPVRCRVEITRDRVSVDFSDSSPQTHGANASLAVMYAAGSIPFLMTIDEDIPHNEGCIEKVSVSGAAGTLCNAHYPAGTSRATVLPGDLMQEVVYRALAELIPERVPAGSARCSNIPFLSAKEEDGPESWGHLFLNGGGGGGAAEGADGWPLITTGSASGGLKIASVEHTELLHPVRVEHCEVEPESMGYGRYIGGPGIRCVITPLEREMNVIDYNDSLLNAPYGVLRGTAGAGGGSYVEGHDGRRRFLGPVVETTVTPGELWVGVSTGGGGYGDPLARDALRVRADVLDGLYSRGVALKVFGVLLSEGPEAELDADATGDLRERLLAAQSESQTRVSSTHPAGAAWVARVSREGDEIPPILAGLVTRVPKENLS